MPRAVTVISATRNIFTALPTASIAKRRTAAYAREDWEFVKIYTDEGISALNTKHRSGFNEMVKDALDGKTDLIVTKSVSYFARNTVDSLVTIRKLKEKGEVC